MSISLGKWVEFPLNGLILDVLSMTLVTIEVLVSGVVKMASAAAGISVIFMVGANYLPWVVNVDDIQGIYHGDPMCYVFRSPGGVQEELSYFFSWFFVLQSMLYINLMT